MSDRTSLQLTPSWDDDTKIMEQRIRSIGSPMKTLQILEAGCGQEWPLNLGDTNFVLTGVDMDKEALEIRVKQKKDLDHAIHDDLRTVQLPREHFDVIFSSFVLEHVSGAATVLDNFSTWLKPGGIVVIRVPDPESVHGFITRVTPHWFHVMYYRIVLGLANAGKPGYAPYPVYYDSVIFRSGIRDWCQTRGMVVLDEFGDGYIRPGRGVVKALISLLKRAISALSLGHLSHRHTNLLYVLQKS